MTPLDERVRRALAPEYEVERRLGEGGMGVVYLAHEVALRRHVAIKMLRPELDTADSVARFLREARALARVKHPNIVTVHHVLEERDGLHFFVMEYIESPLLSTRLKQGTLPPEQVVALGQHLLAGLAAVHRAKVIHLDIKPGNIFLSERGAVLGDFGIARVTDDNETKTSSGRAAGTLIYMPLEMRNGLATERSDLFQVGAVLYESLTGNFWYRAQAGSRAWAAVPRRLAGPIRRAVSVDELERWPDAESFARALGPEQRLGLWATVLLMALAVTLSYVIYLIFIRPEPVVRPLGPRAELTVLPFTGPDSAVSGRLARYVGEPLERFARIAVRPISMSLRLSPPRRPQDYDLLNTKLWVTGEVLNDRLELDVYNARGKKLRTILVPSPAPASIGAVGLLAWGRAAADSLVARQFPQHLVAWRDVGGRGGSDDPLAVDAFLKGEEAFHRDEYESAEARYREALAQDPHFAVALWHRSLTHRWQRIPIENELEVLDRQYRNRLPPQYQVLLAAQLEPELRRRFAAYEAAIADPDNGYAVLLYADELFHRGPLEGIPLDSALAAWKTAIARVPYLEQGPAYDHTIWGAIRQGRQADAKVELARRDQIVSRSRAASGSEGTQRARFFWLTYYARFHPRISRMILWWKFWRPDSTLLRRTARYVRFGLAMDIPDAQRALGQILVRHSLDTTMIAQGHEAQGLALVMLGRDSAAWIQFDSAARAFRSRAAAVERFQWRLLPGAVALPAADNNQAVAARAALEQLERDSAVGARAAWALALEALDRGDSAAAAPSLARLSARAVADSASARLLALLKAIAAAEAGRVKDALTISAPLLKFNPAVRAGDPFARAVLYLRRADWLEEVGNWQEAERSLLWYQNSDIDGWAEGEAQAGDVDAAFSGIARLRRGTLLLDHAQVAQGCQELSRLQQLWHGAEPAYHLLQQELAVRLKACGP